MQVVIRHNKAVLNKPLHRLFEFSLLFWRKEFPMFLLLVEAIIIGKISSFCSVLINLLLRDSLSVRELLDLFGELRVGS